MSFTPSTIFWQLVSAPTLADRNAIQREQSFSRFFGNTFILGDIVLSGAAAASIKPKRQS